MARPLHFEPPKYDARLELIHRLEHAPADHAAALLDLYELIEQLHQKGVLDTARGLVGSGGPVIDIAVRQLLSPSMTNAGKNAALLFNVLCAIDPDQLKKISAPIPAALQTALAEQKPPGLWRLIKQSLFDSDVRRGLGVMLALLRGVGSGAKGGEPAKQ